MTSSYEEAIALIKDRLDIVDVVSDVVVLKKSGANYWGLCPFHKDTKPSMSVNPSKGIYKCFSCGEGGDALRFIMKTQNKEFKEVIEELAEKFGITLPKGTGTSTGTKILKDNMLKACQKAAEFYTKNLTVASDADKARRYLSGRGITESVISKFTLGWASKDYQTLYNHLKPSFSDEILEKAGLILKGKNGEWIDRFRNRIIIPIRNENGDFIAFGARAIEEGQSPKYLNSSDSLIYNKSKVLYGLYTAQKAIKEEDSVIVMEGYFDVISAQANGVENCVASCGTAMTADHVKLLARYTKSRKIFLSFDTDMAGVKATQRGGDTIRNVFRGVGDIKQFDESHMSTDSDKYSCEIRVVSPPQGKDPDEFIRQEGPDAFKEYISQAPLLLDFQLNTILKQKAQSPIEKSNLVKEIIPILKEINNEIIRSEYIKMVANTLSIDEIALSREVGKNVEIFAPRQQQTIIQNRNVTNTSQIELKAQKNLLSLYLVNDRKFSFEQLSEMIPNVIFLDEKLIIVKTTIDKLTDTVNNVRELIDQLFIKFVKDTDIQEIITDLICISEAFNNLEGADFEAVVHENIARLERCKREREREEFRQQYKNVNDDDIEALKLQMQLRDKIKNRTGD